MTAQITHPALATLPGIAHGYFTRQGGRSTGLYASLNCGIGSDDDPDLVHANRATVTAALGMPIQALATPYQVHGVGVAVVKAPWATGEGPRCDGLVTNCPGVAIGIGTADCGPVLLAEAEAGIVGAAHAGWRGAKAGILEATIAAMEGLGADRSRIVAVLGPTISRENYEVGQEMVDQFTADDPANRQWFGCAQREGHAMFNLPGYIAARLRAGGVGFATSMDLCTYADPDRFFSYRRATHRGEPDYGRMLSAIAITE